MQTVIAVSAVVACLLCWHPAAAESFTGKVVNVSDGDTITVLDSENKRIRVRINGIDAPERGRKLLMCTER